MRILKQIVIPIIITGIWINLSETFRWLLFAEPYWIEKYQNLNLTFPSETVNMIAWMVWGFFHARIIFILSKRYSLFETTILS